MDSSSKPALYMYDLIQTSWNIPPPLWVQCCFDDDGGGGGGDGDGDDDGYDLEAPFLTDNTQMVPLYFLHVGPGVWPVPE